MSPPINIDGTQVNGITIDGTNVSEVTVDGDVVFSVSAIPDGRVGNFDATALSLSDGDAVDTWPDTEGDFGDLNADSSRTPVYDADGMNGNPAVEMSEDFFTVTPATEISQPFYFFAVYNNDDANSEQFIFLQKDTGNRVRILQLADGSLSFDVGGTTISGGSADRNNHVVVFGAESGSGFIRFDGTQVASGSVGSTSINGAYQVGNNTFSRYADGSVAQMEYFEPASAFSDSTIQDEEQRLADKFGVSI
jgi:hypothetical protein